MSDRQWDEGIQFNDSENQTFFDDGEVRITSSRFFFQLFLKFSCQLL